MASTSTMSARSSRDSTKKPTLVARISAAAIPAASPNKSAPRAPVATTVPSPASAGQRRACSVGPVRVNSAAESQYMSGGLVRNGSPFMRGVTQSPVTTISRAGSANIPSVSEQPGRPSGPGRTPGERVRAPQPGAAGDRKPEGVLRESAVEKGRAYFESGRHRRAVSLHEVVLGEVEDQVERGRDLPGGSRPERRDAIVRLGVRLRVQDLVLDLRDEQAAQRLGREAPHPAQMPLERGPSHVA